jgi:protein-S-isoprenylcysteine O-methyltransferase Ste14
MTVFSELLNASGAAFFFFLFIIRMVQFISGDYIAMLLAAQSALAAFFLVMHRPVERAAHPIISAIAWVCALLPLAFDLKNAQTLYSLPGLLLALWSLLALRFAFSIAPEDRGVISRGPYHFIRHPMYLGEILSLLGLCITTHSIWNWLVLVLFMRLITLRISAEERVLSGYDAYKKSVRWRLIPFLW